MIESLQTLQWLDYYYYALVAPRSLVESIRQSLSESLIMSTFTISIVVMVEIISLSLLSLQTPFLYTKISYGWMILSIIATVYMLIFSSLIDLACQFTGYKGHSREIFTLVGLSLFPRILLLPIVLIFKIFSFLPVLMYIIASFSLFVWSAMIAIQGISEIHRAGFSRAVLLFVFPFLLFGGVAILSLVYLVIGISGFISFM